MIVENISSQNLNTFIKKTIQIPIEENFICLRSLNPRRTRFEVEYSLEKEVVQILFYSSLLKMNILNYKNIF